jgi:hypothetical protein
MQWLIQLDYWHWLILAVVLMIFEVFSPGGLLLLFPDITWQVQILLFTSLSVANIILVRAFLKRRNTKSESPEYRAWFCRLRHLNNPTQPICPQSIDHAVDRQKHQYE